LQHFVDSFPKEERDFCPAPPKHAKNHLEDGKGKEHIWTAQEMPNEELDSDNREGREHEAGDKRKYEEKTRSPKRDPRLGRG